MSVRRDALRSSFWLPCALAVPLAILLAFALTELDSQADVRLGLFGLADQESARAVLQTIATATISVAGLSFSVTLVALTLAAQQLSPRVLRTFRSDRIAQWTLAGFLGTFAYALIVLARLGAATGPRVPELAVGMAIVLALAAFGGFVAFIGDIVVALQASTVINRIAGDAEQPITARHPHGVGSDPEDPDGAARAVAERKRSGRARDLTAPRAGYLTHVDGAIIERASAADVLVEQRAQVGDFVVTGQVLAQVWAAGGDPEGLDGLRDAFGIEKERTLAADVRFPVRQLADVALRALSPGTNDPTTAENAMGSLADTIVRVIGQPPVGAIRVDGDEVPRLVAKPVSVDELVQLGFEQVRHAARGQPVVLERLVELIEQVDRALEEAQVQCAETARQLRLLGQEA